MSTDWLLAHGIIDAFLAIVLFLVGIMVKSLRDVIEDGKQEQKALTKAINDLNVAVNRDYVTRSELQRVEKDLWDKIDKMLDRMDHINQGRGHV